MATVKVLTPEYGSSNHPIVIGQTSLSVLGSTKGGVYIGHAQMAPNELLEDSNVWIGDNISSGCSCRRVVAIGDMISLTRSGALDTGVCIGMCAYLSGSGSVCIGVGSSCGMTNSVVINGIADGGGCNAISIGNFIAGDGDVFIGFGSSRVTGGYQSLFIGSISNHIAIDGCSGRIRFCIHGCEKSISAEDFFSKLGV